MASIVALVLACAVAQAGVSASTRRARPIRGCPGQGAVVLVDTGAHALTLCRDGVAERAFRVALGRHGVDKRAEGDGRTPRGVYALGSPRPSARFHRFIPVGYPTAEQRSRGYTGSAVGLHGPHRLFRWFGPSTVAVDWTQGCVALGTQAEIDAIAAWVAVNDAHHVELR